MVSLSDNPFVILSSFFTNLSFFRLHIVLNAIVVVSAARRMFCVHCDNM